VLVGVFRSVAALVPQLLNAVGQARLNFFYAIFSSVLMPVAFFVGGQFSLTGVAWAWVAAYPLVVAVLLYFSARVLEVSLPALLGAIVPGGVVLLPALGAGLGLQWLTDTYLSGMPIVALVLGVLGTSELAAYAVGRRVVLFAMMPAWGYSTAASTLVGQAVGGGDDEAATSYGWQTTRIALATQLLVAAVIAAFAPSIARGFGTEDVALTATFVRVFALGVAGFSVSRTMRGALRGAGDTRWPFYGTVVGTYLVRLPVAFLALPVGYAVTLGPFRIAGVPFGPFSAAPGMGFGVAAAFAAILAGLYVKAVVNTARFASGRWVAVARSARGATPGDD